MNSDVEILNTLLNQSDNNIGNITFYREIVEATELTNGAKKLVYEEYSVPESKLFSFTMDYCKAAAVLMQENNEYYIDSWEDIEFKTIDIDDIKIGSIKKDYYDYYMEEKTAEEIYDFFEGKDNLSGLKLELQNWAKNEIKNDQLEIEQSKIDFFNALETSTYTILLSKPCKIYVNKNVPNTLNNYNNFIIFNRFPNRPIGGTGAILTGHGAEVFYEDMKNKGEEIYKVDEGFTTFCIFDISKELIDIVLPNDSEYFIWWVQGDVPRVIRSVQYNQFIDNYRI